MREIPGLGTLRDVEQDSIVVNVKYFGIERCRYLHQDLDFQSIPFLVAALLDAMSFGYAF